MRKIYLASDNYSSAHPKIMQALIEANEGYSPAYGYDEWTKKARDLIQSQFTRDSQVLILPTGTGANILALTLCCKRYESIICTDIAHINTNESGAPESVVGCKLLTILHENGKITPEALLKKLRSEKLCGEHATSPRLLSITQPTEVGTVYTLQELQVLSKICKEEKLLFHMDGSRIYNAAVYLQTSLKEIVESANLDILSLGGAKNGLINAESLVIFNPSLKEGSNYLQKQTLQLLSKMRYISAQYIPFFKDNLWYELANNANKRAQELVKILKQNPKISINYPVETNQIFFSVPASWIPKIQEKIACYLWDEDKNEIRFVTSWNTSEEDIRAIQNLNF